MAQKLSAQRQSAWTRNLALTLHWTAVAEQDSSCAARWRIGVLAAPGQVAMNEALYFEDLHVGQSWRTFARTITEADVVHFAGLTGDYDPLHIDHHYARQTPFGRPIAHGLLGLSVLAGLGIHSPRAQTAAFVSIENWRFLKPIFFGDTVHAVNEVIALANEGRRRGRVTWKRALVNQDGVIVQEGLLVTLVNRRTPLGKDASAPATDPPASA